MIDGGEIIVTKVRDVAKVLPPVDPTATDTLVKGKEKEAKANQKGKENLFALPWVTAALNLAATVPKLDTSTVTVANEFGMKNRANKKQNQPTITTLNMRLTSRWMRPP